jgi:hypothetical protein
LTGLAAAKAILESNSQFSHIIGIFTLGVVVIVVVIVWRSQAVPHNRNDCDGDNDNRPVLAGLTTTSGISKNRFPNRQLQRVSFSSQAATPVG